MAIFKRDGSKFWQYEFEYKGKRYRGSTERTNKTDAVLVEAERRKEAREEGASNKRRVALWEAVQAWLRAMEAKAAGDRGRDLRSDQSRARKLFGIEKKLDGSLVEGARFGLSRDLLLRDLETSALTELIDERVAEGNSGGTINRELALVQAVLTWARDRRYELPPDPINFARLKQDEGGGKLRWLTLTEEDAMLDVLRSRVTRYGGATMQDQYDLAVCGLDTGARYSEIALLSWDTVDFSAGTVNLYRHKVGNGSLLAMTDRLREVLERRRRLTEGRRYIFPGCDGRSWDVEDKPRGYSTSGVRSAIDEAGLNAEHLVERYGRANFHTLRHTFASRLVQAGVSLFKVQQLLGHTTPTMTQRYAKLAPGGAAAEAAAVLNRLRRPATENAL